MNRYFYKGIRFRMTFLFSVVFMLMNLFFGSIIYRNIKSEYINNYKMYLKSRAEQILDRTELNPDVIALPDSGESIRVFYHNNFQKELTVFQSPGAISRLQVPYHTGIVDTLSQYGVYLKKENYDGRPVELLFTVSNAPLRKKLDSFSLLITGAFAASLLVSAVAAFLASGWLLKPIRSIANQAAGINAKKLAERIGSVNTHDELQLLTETINEMIGRIEQEQQARNNFFAAASHELRTPLANLRAQTELELGNSHTQADLELLGSQLTEIIRLQSIVEQFLLISEFNNGNLSLRKSMVNISDQVLRMFSRNSRMAENRNITYSIQFSENIASFDIAADTEKLEIVFQNLVYNAIKYADEGTVLKCEVEEINGDKLKISFTNHINQERIELSGLKTPFNKGNSTTSGSGLGIWLSKEIIEAHQGSIKIESKQHLFIVQLLLPVVEPV